MDSELVKKALEKVVNSHILVNLVSRRVRQLNADAGKMSRPLVAGTENLRMADIALREIIEGKMDFEVPELVPLTRLGLRRAGPRGWESVPTRWQRAIVSPPCMQTDGKTSADRTQIRG